VPEPGSPAGLQHLVAGLTLAAAPELPVAPEAPVVEVGSPSIIHKTPSTNAKSASQEIPSLLTLRHSGKGASNTDSAETNGCDPESVQARRDTRRAKMMVRLLHRKLRRGVTRQKKRSEEGCEGKGGSELGTRSYTASEAGQSVIGGWDVSSQSSKLSCVGSVTMACRQLLGPLHDHLPPEQYVSKRIEDHLSCAAEMVRLRVPANIKKLQRERELAEWRDRAQNYELHSMLSRGHMPEGSIGEDIWRTHLLPNLESPPGKRPSKPPPPDDNELWLRAWKRTYEDTEEGSEDSEASSDDD